MSTAKFIAFSMILGGLFLAGCTKSTTMLEENWGRSVETALYTQTLNPTAGASTEPVEGMSGKSALNVLNGYSSGFAGQKTSSSTGIADTQ